MTLQAMVKHIEMWLIDKLIPYAKNPRTHSDAQVAQIAAKASAQDFQQFAHVRTSIRHAASDLIASAAGLKFEFNCRARPKCSRAADRTASKSVFGLSSAFTAMILGSPNCVA